MLSAEGIKNTLNEYFGDQNLEEDFDIIQNRYLDSLRLAELIVFIESKFNIDVFADELTRENFRTIRSIVGYISKKTDIQN